MKEFVSPRDLQHNADNPMIVDTTDADEERYTSDDDENDLTEVLLHIDSNVSDYETASEEIKESLKICSTSENKDEREMKRLYFKARDAPHQLYGLKSHGIVYKWTQSIFHNEEKDLWISCQKRMDLPDREKKRKATSKSTKMKKSRKENEH